MNLFNIAFLGLLQGLAEFLPISSSGHLVLAQNIMGLKEPGIIIEASLHLGTMLSIVLIYREDFVKLFKSLMPLGEDEEMATYRKLLLLIVAGTLPAAFVGVFLKDSIESLFSSSIFVGFALIATAALLLLGRRLSGSRDLPQMGYFDALIIGTWQAFAILPGISRSGSTIVGGMLRGIKPETAAKYSLLMSMPAVLGANLVALKDADFASLSSFYLLLAGTVVSFIAGVFAIKMLLKIISNKRLGVFAVYCIIVGTITVLYEIL